MTALKDAIAAAIDRLGDDLEKLSRRIHDNPELCFQEVKAAGWLCDFLAGQGFKVERGLAGVDTAFRATIETGDGPTIAIMCEYDALPSIGHACGHNAIATAGAGAGAGLAAVRDKLPKGRIHVVGTPAEEGGGGKVKLIAHNDTVYEPMRRNETLLGAYRANLTSLGIVEAPPLVDRLGSSDVGNVSQIIPTIQPLMKIAPDNTPIHSRAFEAAAVSPLARAGTLTAAKAMAMTTLDLLAEPALVKRAQDEFRRMK